jgi:hypothetical protein
MALSRVDLGSCVSGVFQIGMEFARGIVLFPKRDQFLPVAGGKAAPDAIPASRKIRLTHVLANCHRLSALASLQKA